MMNTVNSVIFYCCTRYTLWFGHLHCGKSRVQMEILNLCQENCLHILLTPIDLIGKCTMTVLYNT